MNILYVNMIYNTVFVICIFCVFVTCSTSCCLHETLLDLWDVCLCVCVCVCVCMYVCMYTLLQNLTVSAANVASASEQRSSAILLVLFAGKYDVQHLDTFYCHIIFIKLLENRAYVVNVY
jgi:drug/metabolite transporter (DMT)-like permease